MGVRAIRTLLSYTAAELGHGAFPRVSLTVDSNTYTLLSVLGRGAFCTAFLGTVKRDGNAETLVTIKRAGLVNNNKHSVALTQLQAECDIIRTFSERASACEKLPKLYDVLWNVSPAAPFIPILPVGVPLERRHTELKPGARTVEAGALFSDINAALTAAHALGLCHRDVRPQNVVFNPIGRHYCLIDWGLAAAPGTPLHPHRGGMPFSHDEVVMARVKNEQINTRPEHDVASVRFVAWAFSVGKKLSVPWAGMSTHLITIRNAAVGDAFL